MISVPMSLKPRNVDFQEMWSSLKETVAGVVGLQSVERSVWNLRFSDVYALCVAHPEPLADKLYDETKNFLEDHVSGLLHRVKGHTSLDGNDPGDGLLTRYVTAWGEYSQGVAYLNCLYSYLNLQHVKRQKLSDAEIIYGSSAAVSTHEQESRQLEVGELGLEIWERVLLGGVGGAVSERVVGAIARARQCPLDPALADTVRRAVLSTVDVRAFRVRAPLSLYSTLVLEPYLAAAAAHHARHAADLLSQTNVSHYMQCALQGLEREEALVARFLHSSSRAAARSCYEAAALAAHLGPLHAHVPALMERAAPKFPSGDEAEARVDLKRMYILLKPLGADAMRPLIDAAHAQAAAEGHYLLKQEHNKEEAHIYFVSSMLALHKKYQELFQEVFQGAQTFLGALDKACSEVVNARGGDQPARAPELLARYCDTLLRKKNSGECDTEDKLTAAIVVFKYVDDKDVFQKCYARSLARRLIYQLSASMEQEEAMINRLKAACGYEFTNKLHRMFTDVAVSADLNTKFQQHLRDDNIPASAGFQVQVLQAGAWPLGGAMAPLAPPLQLEQPARLFEAFYRRAFSGRRLAWLHHLCTGDLRTRYTQRVYHISATTHQCALLLYFESVDSAPAREVRDALQLSGEAWARHLRPLLDAQLLTATGDACGISPTGEEEETPSDATLHLNLAFSCKRTKVRLMCATPSHQGSGTGGGGTEGAEASHCDDDRKMYLQAAIVRIMKQRKILRHTELVQEVVSLARVAFAPSVAMIKKCIEALIDKQYLERAPHALDTYSYLA